MSPIGGLNKGAALFFSPTRSLATFIKAAEFLKLKLAQRDRAPAGVEIALTSARVVNDVIPVVAIRDPSYNFLKGAGLGSGFEYVTNPPPTVYPKADPEENMAIE